MGQPSEEVLHLTSCAIFSPSRAASSAVSELLQTRLALAKVRSAPACPGDPWEMMGEDD